MVHELDNVRRINHTIVHDDGVIDSFERQLLYLNSGIFDVTMPLVVSPNSIGIDYLNVNKEKPITMRVGTAQKIRDKHAIGYAFVGQCLDLIKNSVLAFDSLTHPTSKVVVLDVFNEEGNPYIAICRTNKRMSGVEVYEITSIYDKKNIAEFMTRTYMSDKRFYKNKKTEQYIKSHRFQLPREMIYALSDDYYKSSFNKSQVDNDNSMSEILKNDEEYNISSVDSLLADAYSRSYSIDASENKRKESDKIID